MSARSDERMREIAGNNEQLRRDLADAAATSKDKAIQDKLDSRDAAALQLDQRAYQGISSAAESTIASIEQLLAHPGLPAITGKRGMIPNIAIFPDAANADALLKEVKNKVAIDTLTALRAASKTGSSGFGQLTEREGLRLESYKGNLEAAQTEQQMRDQLGKVKTELRDMTVRLQPGRPAGGSRPPPPDVDPALWSNMTPEEQALWP
jgi:hypothetical protein